MTVSNTNSKDVSDIDSDSLLTFSYTFDAIEAGNVYVELFDTDGASLDISFVQATPPGANQYSVDIDSS